MAKVCVITGGGSGMGLSAAKFMDKSKIIILSGRTEAKLQKAIDELTSLGFTAYAKACDTSKRESVQALVEFAVSKGEVTNVINSAGVSPAMSKPEPIVRINALGTVYINQEFSKVMKEGSVMSIPEESLALHYEKKDNCNTDFNSVAFDGIVCLEEKQRL